MKDKKGDKRENMKFNQQLDELKRRGYDEFILTILKNRIKEWKCFNPVNKNETAYKIAVLDELNDLKELIINGKS